MKILFKYLYSHIKILIMLILFTVVFVVVFSLYNLPIEPVMYAAVLCILVGLTVFTIAFLIFLRKHKVLTGLKKNITVTIDGLPNHNRIIEKDYSELVKILHSQNRKLADYFDMQRRDMLQFYTLWVHQIKTPISAMRLLLQTQKSAVNSELETELFKIEQYVEMVLGYLRSDNPSSDLMIKKYELDNIIKQVIRKYAKEFIRRKVSLEYKGLNYQVLTDEKWLVFIIEQLISNALKYTKDGKISIYMKDYSGKNNTGTLIIEDTGIGIQAEDLPRIFERGFTGYNGRTDKKSTGLGLYLVKRITKLLGHTIEVESGINLGTKVMLHLNNKEIDFD